MGSGGIYAGYFAVSSCHQKSLPLVHGTSAPVLLYTSTRWTSGHLLSASSTIFLVPISLPPRFPSSVVITTLELASMIRSAKEPDKKPAKTTEWMAPIRVTARKEMTASGIMG